MILSLHPRQVTLQSIFDRRKSFMHEHKNISTQIKTAAAVPFVLFFNFTVTTPQTGSLPQSLHSQRQRHTYLAFVLLLLLHLDLELPHHHLPLPLRDCFSLLVMSGHQRLHVCEARLPPRLCPRRAAVAVSIGHCTGRQLLVASGGRHGPGGPRAGWARAGARC